MGSILLLIISLSIPGGIWSSVAQKKAKNMPNLINTFIYIFEAFLEAIRHGILLHSLAGDDSPYVSPSHDEVTMFINFIFI